MPPKHSLESSPAARRPFKRRHILLSDGTAASAPVTPVKTPYSYPYIPSTSSTPYPSYPSDSPSNPFGRKRTLAISTSLPKPTGFGRHMPLRFQFFRHGMKRDKNGVYRIVQVPLSYTFNHLRSLIAFLFGGQEGFQEEREGEDEGTGHLFEVRKNVVLYSKAYRPGTIKQSETYVRLSSVRDPYRYKQEWDFGDDWGEDEDEGNEDTENAAPEEADSMAEDDDEDVIWEAEEDFTLGHVWEARKRDDSNKKAIVYYHTSSSDHPTQVQITLCLDPVPRRKGAGNEPHVFEARGHVYLSPPSNDASECEDEENEINPYEENFKLEIDPATWNEPEDAFASYILETTSIPPPDLSGNKRRIRRASSPSLSSTPGLIYDSSSPAKTPSSSFSSPFNFLSQRSPHPAIASSPFRESASFTNIKPLFSSSTKYPKYTPAPPLAQRKRMAYIQRRIERSKHKGKVSETAKDAGKGSSKSKAIVITDSEEDGEGEQVDQLADDDDDGGDLKNLREGGVKGMDGERLTYEQAMEILSRDDDVEEV